MNINYVTTFYKEASEWKIYGISILVQFTLLLVKVPLVYSLFYIINQAVSKKWGLLISILSTLILFGIAVYLYFVIDEQLLQRYILIPMNLTKLQGVSVRSIVSVLFVLGFACGMAITAKLIRANIKQKEIEYQITQQKLHAELNFLKAQTNPHFLFNTLNNIYALARKKSDDTADTVMQLSKLLRFMLYESKKDKITIAEEIQILEDYIKLEKIRYTENLKLSIYKSIDDDKILITPLILLPFVENAFKHGASENRFGTDIDIKIILSNQSLDFKIINSKPNDDPRIESIPGLGLANVKRQLELLYPNHTLDIKNEANTFSVQLKLALSKNA